MHMSEWKVSFPKLITSQSGRTINMIVYRDLEWNTCAHQPSEVWKFGMLHRCTLPTARSLHSCWQPWIIKSGSGKPCDFSTISHKNFMYCFFCRANWYQRDLKLSRFVKFLNCCHGDWKNSPILQWNRLSAWVFTYLWVTWFNMTISRSLQKWENLPGCFRNMPVKGTQNECDEISMGWFASSICVEQKSLQTHFTWNWAFSK